jgi:hypothetical protein
VAPGLEPGDSTALRWQKKSFVISLAANFSASLPGCVAYGALGLWHASRVGLAAVLTTSIAESMGGSLRLEADAGPGACFVLELPYRAPQPAPRAATKPAATSLSGRVLVVEDEEDIRSLLGTVLGDLGLETRLETSGNAALARLGVGLVLKPFDVAQLTRALRSARQGQAI